MITYLTKEQRKSWNKMLNLALTRERNKTPLTVKDKKILEWHKRYQKLMLEKLELL